MLSEGASEPLRRPLRGRLVPGLALTVNSPVQRPLILVCLARTELARQPGQLSDPGFR